MALLNLPHQSSLFSLQQHKPQTQSNFNSIKNVSSTCFLPLSSPLTYTLPLKASRFSSFVLRFSATTQDPVLKVEEQQEEEKGEFSNTRLIAQNVPYTCTAEDIRSLFEKHGKVLDVEVFDNIFYLGFLFFCFKNCFFFFYIDVNVFGF